MMNMRFVSVRTRVLEKSGYRCSICGSYDDVKVGSFIPRWTKVRDDYRNKIPMCKACMEKYSNNLIELGSLQYLPARYKRSIMRYYIEWQKYLHKFIMMLGLSNNSTSFDLEHSKLALQSYDIYIEKNKLV